ncbi:hypothetical protein ACJZD7_28905, partial [Klebsiella pneumoniae]
SVGEISVKTGNNARNGGKNSLNRLIRCVCGKKIGPDPRNFNQRVSLGRNDLLIRTFLSFSVLLFIGYVTRIFVIFTKYYMQLSNDYENQKIAYMLSRGDISKFSSTLDALRNHNISFDKTPHPPQEKLIAGLTEAIAAQTKSKFKNEN